MNVVILGSRGSLGSELSRVFRDDTALSSSDLDIRDAEKVDSVLGRLKPRYVINAAAYTNVDGAEKDRHAALGVNHIAVLLLAKACRRYGARLIHFSTDYVFDGNNPNGYLESDERIPINAYGESKAAGEKAIEQISDDYLIIRTAWLYGRGKSFPAKLLDRARSMGLVSVVNDQFGSPTYAADLAERIPQILDAPTGIYHLTNTGIAASWFDVAEEVIKISGVECAVLPKSTEEHKKEFPNSARRPKYSILLNSKMQITGPPMRDWKSALLDYMKRENLVKS